MDVQGMEPQVWGLGAELWMWMWQRCQRWVCAQLVAGMERAFLDGRETEGRRLSLLHEELLRVERAICDSLPA